LILARGGGSLEDLWAFNDERLARAIVASPIPVITGIGHEVDFTIADFAADVRAPTPSAAAELVVPDADEWRSGFVRVDSRLQRCMIRRLGEHLERLRWLTGRLGQVSPTARLSSRAQRLDELEQALLRAWRHIVNSSRSALGDRQSRLWQASPAARVRDAASRHAALFVRLQAAGLEQTRRARERLLPLVRTLNAVSPLATLERGYAIVSMEGGQILRDAADASPGTLIEARLARGSIRAKVETGP
jgi:exodeoxyribonuclease VII large subunit